MKHHHVLNIVFNLTPLCRALPDKLKSFDGWCDDHIANALHKGVFLWVFYE